MTAQAATITFKATPYLLRGNLILRLPQVASDHLSSRGQVAVAGTVGECAFTAVLEPDGSWGHWLRIDGEMAGVQADSEAALTIVQTNVWPEPTLPPDFKAALTAAPGEVRALWQDITPMARWEWVRWISATTVEETRARRISVSISKLQSGKRRPCCFNLAACTDPLLSKGGKLIERT